MTTAESPLDFLKQQARDRGANGKSPVEIPGATRSILARWFCDLGFTKGVEIGVKEGDYSVELLEANPNLTLWSVDPWLVREEYYDRRGQKVFSSYEQVARERLGAFGERSIILKELSHEAERRFKRHELDFVYIDGHHNLYNVIRDIHLWSARVRPGGIIAGHDFTRFKNQAMHVVQGVMAYTDAYRIDPWFVLGRKSEARAPANVLPVNGQRDRHRTFLWVRPGYEANMKDYDPTIGGLAEMP